MSDKEVHVVKVGSRKSQLALIQTCHVISLLAELNPDKKFEIVKMTTLGDRVDTVSLPKIGEKALFTKDLEDALRLGAVDLVVHSLKDLPTSLPHNMAIGAVLEREDPRDALVLREDFHGHTLATLPPGSIIGTSSLRRTAQINRSHPHLKVVDIRGNLNTRLKKLDFNCKSKPQLTEAETELNKTHDETSKTVESSNGTPSFFYADKSANERSTGTPSAVLDGTNAALNGIPELNQTGMQLTDVPNYVALILAQAGLVRMGWQSRISQVLPCKEVLYAVGQGALAIECMATNTAVLQMLAPLNHADTFCRVLAERSFLKTLDGGCSAPVAVATVLKLTPESAKRLKITGAVWSLNGETKIEEKLVHVFEDAKAPAKPSGCPFEAKNKAIGKHKLSESNGECSEVKIDEPDSKMFKSGGETSCRRKISESQGSGDDKKIVNCCRMKVMKSAMDNAEPIDIENLINKHGKLFMLCPFAEGKKRVCPVEYPIGQEVMGECPYFSDGEGLSETLVKMHPRRPSYDIKKCPFMANQAVAISSQMEMSNLSDAQVTIPAYDIINEPKAKNCPFLKQNTATENNDTNSTVSTVKSDTETCTEQEIKLFCGLTKHFNLSEEVLDKCEDLGRELANKLIEHGALKVMQCAQNFIRSSIPKTAAVILQP